MSAADDDERTALTSLSSILGGSPPRIRSQPAFCKYREVAHSARDPADWLVPSNHHGGFYELSLDLGPADDVRLGSALDSLWVAAGLSQAVQRAIGPTGFAPVAVAVTTLLAGPLIAVAEIPGLGRTMCKVLVIREETLDVGEMRYGNDWLDLSLPLGSLAELDARVGGYPFGDTSESGSWRMPIERWFEGIIRSISASVPFAHGVSGFEVSGMDRDECEMHLGRIAIFQRVGTGEVLIKPVAYWVNDAR